MRFDKLKDPTLLAARVASRYAAQGVAIVEQGERTFLAATDGRCLTLVRAYPEDGDDTSSAVGNGRVYPVAAFAAARKAAKRKADASLTLNGAAFVNGADGSHAEFPKLDGAFPDVWAVVPKGEPVGVLRIDAELLARVQKALGASAVEIRVHAMEANGREVDPSLPLTIVPVYIDGAGEEDGSRGFLMPVKGD